MHTNIDKLLGEYCLLSKDGSNVFRYKNKNTIFSENIVILESLRLSVSFDSTCYNDFVDPLIHRLFKVVSIAPASKCLHDCDAGGLFRHSLLVALKIIEISKYTNFQYGSLSTQELQVLLIFIAFIHDCGKVLSDCIFSVSESSFKYDQNDLNYTLDDFINSFNSSLVKVEFNSNRIGSHENIICEVLPFLLYRQTKLGEFLTNPLCKKAINALVLSDKNDPIYKLLKVADIYACKTSINEFSPLFEIGNYLKLLFYSNIIDISEKGFYRVHGGYVVEKGSFAYQKILKAFDFYYSLLDECSSFSKLSSTSFEKLYTECSSSVLYNELNLSNSDNNKEQSHNYPKRSFFVELSDSNFFVQGAYKRTCIWRKLYCNQTVKFVYGFAIALDCFCHVESSGSDSFTYKITDELQDKSIKDFLLKDKFVAENLNVVDITSFSVMSPDDLHMFDLEIDYKSICTDTFSCDRRKRLEIQSKQRAKDKAKEKSLVNANIKSLQDSIANLELDSAIDDYMF